MLGDLVAGAAVLVHLGVHVDLVGPGVLGRVHHGLPGGPDQGPDAVGGRAVADHHHPPMLGSTAAISSACFISS